MATQTTLKEIGEMLAHVVKHVVTKDDLKAEFDPIKKTLAEHTEILDGHTRRLASIENNQGADLDKRKQLEVRVTKIEAQLSH